MRVDFYHLTRSGPDNITAILADKLVGSGERLLIVADDVVTLEKLDAALWTGKPESFMPHNVAGKEGNDDSAEPVLLAQNATAVNGAANILLADGEWRDEALDFARTFYLFDASSIDNARTAWKALGSKDGIERHYWKQDEQGRWAEGP